MRNILKVTKYHLFAFTILTWICFCVLISQLIITGLVLFFTRISNLVIGGIDSSALIMIFIFGILFFKPSFKYMLANGISRKSFFWGNIPVLAITAVAWAIINKLLELIFKIYANYILSYELVYKGISLTGGVIWMSSALFLLVTLGWFIGMLYYRSGSLLKLIISITPIVFIFLLFFNNLTRGLLSDAIFKLFVVTMGFSTGIPNPYIAALSMVIFAALICGFNFLLIRRAPIKD